ncbi:MAG: DMT family transporter [Desulfovibrio sp.]|uniref:DMT family transporter n=1 Tax=Desulfovibrio sp. 7SRBS1 TaxID=3378064 RepID=UPI003B427195
MRSRLASYTDLSLAMVIVGSSVVAGKLAIAEFPVFLALGLRFVLAVAIIVPFLLYLEKGLPRIGWRDFGLLAFQCFCGGVLFNVFLLYGLQWTNPASAGVITSSTPAVIGLISFVFLREKPGLFKLLGIGAAMAGVAVLRLADNSAATATAGAAGATDTSVWGYLLVFGAVLGESIFLVLRKSLHADLSALAVSFWISLLGMCMFAPMAVYQGLGFDFGAVSKQGWLVIVYYAVAITVLAYVFWFRGIRDVPASSAAVFTGILPVSAVLLCALVLDDPVGPWHWAGCGGVAVGILLIARGERRHTKAPEAPQTSQPAKEKENVPPEAPDSPGPPDPIIHRPDRPRKFWSRRPPTL